MRIYTVSFNSVARKEGLNRSKDKYKLTKMEAKTIQWVGMILTIIIGWEKISTFLNSFFEGLSEVLKSLPPILVIGLIIFILWALGHKK